MADGDAVLCFFSFILRYATIDNVTCHLWFLGIIFHLKLLFTVLANKYVSCSRSYPVHAITIWADEWQDKEQSGWHRFFLFWAFSCGIWGNCAFLIYWDNWGSEPIATQSTEACTIICKVARWHEQIRWWLHKANRKLCFLIKIGNVKYIFLPNFSKVSKLVCFRNFQ